jgi:hypothetical protein
VGGKPNQKGLDFYSRLVDGMLERGLQPWATLYHWDLPQYLQDRGGWNERATVDAFVELADAMTRTLGDRVKHWITHNEPWCTAIIGNFEGWHAPGLTDFKTALQVSHHVLLSHGKAVPVIRANVPDAKVGISLSLHPLRAASASPRDIAAMERHDGLRYRWFLDPLYGRGYPAADPGTGGRRCAGGAAGRPGSDRRADRFPGRELLLPRDHRRRSRPRAAGRARAAAEGARSRRWAGRSSRRAWPSCWRGSRTTTTRARST